MGVAIYFLLKQLSTMQDNVDRLVTNFEQAMDDNSKVLIFTTKEMKKYNRDTLLRKLMDSLNLKYKHIIDTHNETYIHNYDTTIYMVVESDSVWSFSNKFDDCVSIKGKVYPMQKAIHIDNPITYNSTSAYFWQRPKKFWFIHYGKKQFFVRNLNNCTGETKIEEIKIEK
jgi:hypothetical protein